MMLWIVVVLVLVFIVVLSIAKQRSKPSSENVGYQKQIVLFTPAERSFLGVLDLAAGKDFRVFGKVRVGDLLAPRQGLSNQSRQATLNRINRKHFDFVLCRPDDLTVLCAIELNDKSHQKKQRQDRDEFLLDACRSAGLPLLMFDAQHAYSPVEVSAKIAAVLSGSGQMSMEPPLSETLPESPPADALATEIAPLCPRCSGQMVKRIAKGGENAGKEFWGCSNFPKCREIVTI